MKKVIRLTESDLVRLVNRIVGEQFDGEIESPQDNGNSGYEELKSRLERYQNKMDRFLDELKLLQFTVWAFTGTGSVICVVLVVF